MTARAHANSATFRKLAAFLPWSGGVGRRRRARNRGVLAAPFVVFYLTVSWAIFLPGAQRVPGNIRADLDRYEAYLFHMPDLIENFPRALRSLATAPWLNHNAVQLVYITILLLLVGLAFEAHEGTRTTILVFFATSFVGAVGSGLLLRLIYPAVIDTDFLGHAWSRTWSGGSVGCFGLMGALAARAPRPWLLLALFVFWEVNVVWWYLREWTPAFHLTALFSGFVGLRYAAPLARRWARRTQSRVTSPRGPFVPR